MKPSRDEVTWMVGALMTVVRGVERAKRRGKAATLALLYAVAEREPVRPSELSVELGVHQSSVTRQVQALEAEGQVSVAADPQDGRSCVISLTPAGRKEVARLTEVGLDRFSAFVADWDPAEVRELARLLSKLTAGQVEVAAREARPAGPRWREKKARAGEAGREEES